MKKLIAILLVLITVMGVMPSMMAEEVVEDTLHEEHICEECEGEYITPVDYTEAAPLLSFATDEVEEEPVMSTFNLLRTTKMMTANYQASPTSTEDVTGSEDFEGRIDEAKLHTTKEVVVDADGNYTINIEAFLEGNPAEKEYIPSDIVLVIDQSTSMSFCFQCGSGSGLMELTAVGNSINTGGISEEYPWYRVDHDLNPDTKREEVFYCPGNKVEGYKKCQHSMAGWFDVDHKTIQENDGNGAGNRYVPSIADAKKTDDNRYNKHIDGGNQNIYARVFYKGTTAGSAVNQNLTTTGVYYLDIKQDSYMDDCEELVYCANHAAWHLKSAAACTDANPNKEWYVPRNDKTENVLGSNRFMYVNLSHHKFTTTSSLDTNEKYWVKKNGNDPKRGDTYIQVSYSSGKWRGTDNKEYTVAETDGASTSGQRIFYKKCSQYGSRYQAAQTALGIFSDDIYTYSELHDVKNRIAVVSFASPGYSAVQSNVSGSVVTPVKESDADANTYKNALHFVDEDSGQSIIDSAIASIHDHGGGTYTHLGLQMASKILANVTDNGKRNKIVILFTDGQPQVQSTGADPYGGAERALEQANLIKQNAYLYSIGIFSGADAENQSCVTMDTVANASGYITQKESSNKLMNLLSSNYPYKEAAPSMANNYNVSEFEKGYYLSASNADSLVEAFRNIAEKINAASALEYLTGETIVKDVISSQFVVDNADSSKAITFHTESFTGKSVGGDFLFTDDATTDSNIRLVPNSDPRIIEVTGFSFTDNYVAMNDTMDGQEPHGKKLVITIPIKVNPDFLGGDDVYTNTKGSGIYVSEHCYEQFVLPTVDIPLKDINPEIQDGYIYVSETGVLPHLANIGHFSYEDGEETLSTTVDGINNAYVKIEYTISDLPFNTDGSLQTNAKAIHRTVEAGTSHTSLNHSTEAWADVAEHTGLVMEDTFTEDTPYYVQIKVSPTTTDDDNDGVDVKPVNKSSDAWIYVFTPHITFKDSEIELGETAGDYDDVNCVSVEWKHKGEDPTAEELTRLGMAPTLSYTYDNDPEDRAFTKDTPVKVTEIHATKANSDDDSYDHKVDTTINLLEYATFYREACTFCGHTAGAVDTEQEDWCNFIVHIKSFDLVIVKDVTVSEYDENQASIFRVYKGENALMDVVIKGNGQTTVKNLPLGEYNVEELTDWSWRYEPEEVVQSVNTSSAENGVITVEFKNTRTEEKWLSGDSFARNLWGSGATGIVDSKAE